MTLEQARTIITSQGSAARYGVSIDSAAKLLVDADHAAERRALEWCIGVIDRSVPGGSPGAMFSIERRLEELK